MPTPGICDNVLGRSLPARAPGSFLCRHLAGCRAVMQALSSVSMLRAMKRGFSNEGVPFEQLNGCRLVHFTTFSQTSVG
jgi:hypothetical protein